MPNRRGAGRRGWQGCGSIAAIACLLATISTAAEGDPLDSLIGEPSVETSDSSSETSRSPERPRSALVEEIVVTAQKRAENLQDVPISVQAFSAEQLDAKGILDSKDLVLTTPGLTVTTQVSYTSTFIRGVGSDAFLLADPSVVHYVDGIYHPFSNNLIQDFGTIERVEVLKGPQGTLFGRNALGGAINVTSKTPSLDAAEAYLQTGYLDYGVFQNRAHVSAPLWRDRLALSISGLYNDGEHHVDGTQGGRPLPREIAKGGRAKARFAPTDWIDLEVTGYRVESQGVGTNYSPNVAPSFLGGLAGIEPQDPYAGAVNEPTFLDHTNTTVYGKGDLFFEWFDVKLLGSDQRAETFANYDFDGSPEPLALFQVEPVFADVRTGEIQILSNDTSWGAGWLRWIVGGYSFESRQGFSKGFLRAATTDLADDFVLGARVPPSFADAIDALSDLPIPTGTFDFVGLIDTDSLAGFGQVTVDFTEWIALTFGGRYQVEERTLAESSSGFRNLDGSVTPIQSYTGLRDTTESFKPKVSLDVRWFEDTLLYVSWQEAIKSSTYNVVNIYDPPDFVRPEDLEAWEIGAKTRFWDGILTLNAAAFQYEIEDQQVQFVSLFEGGAVTFENAADSRIRGVDFDGVAQILPRWTDLVLTFGGAYLDAIYESYPNGSGFDPDTGLLTQDNDFSGNRIVRSPEFSGFVGLYQTFGTPLGLLEVGTDYYYNSGFFYLAQNRASDEEDAHGVWNARVGLRYEPWSLRLTVFVNNLADEEYNFSRFIADFGTNDARAPLRHFGVRLRWEY